MVKFRPVLNIGDYHIGVSFQGTKTFVFCSTEVSQAVILPGLLPGRYKPPFSLGLSVYMGKDPSATQVFSPWENDDSEWMRQRFKVIDCMLQVWVSNFSPSRQL